MAASQWLRDEGGTERALPPLYWAESWIPAPATFEITTVTQSVAALQRARVEEALGHGASAERYYREFLRLYDMPAERHRHLVAEAEAALVRLTGIGNPIRR